MNKKKQTMILETSVIINNIFNRKINSLLKEKQKKFSLRSSYFILFEFKRGFIGNLIRYYLLIEQFGYSEAKRLLTYPMNRRLSNAVSFLESYMSQNKANILTEDQEALFQIESYISIFLDLFSSAFTHSELLGHTIKNTVINFDLSNSSNYKKFIELIDSNENPIMLKDFFSINRLEFEKLKQNELKIDNQNFRELLLSMKVITECINNGDIRLDSNCLFVLGENKHVGDSIIAVDMSSDYCLLTIDKIFKDVCSSLDKKVEVVKLNADIHFSNIE